jgi:hypothetical protein
VFSSSWSIGVIVLTHSVGKYLHVFCMHLWLSWFINSRFVTIKSNIWSWHVAFWSLYRWGVENYFERSGDCDVNKQDKANQCKGEKEHGGSPEQVTASGSAIWLYWRTSNSWHWEWQLSWLGFQVPNNFWNDLWEAPSESKYIPQKLQPEWPALAFHDLRPT